jgi:hypothetical protein
MFLQSIALERWVFIGQFFQLMFISQPNIQRYIFWEIDSIVENKEDSKKKRKKRKKEMYQLCQSVQLRVEWLNEKFVYFIDRNCYLWDVNQFVVGWNSPVERVPHNDECFMICHDTYSWLDDMNT